LVSVLQSTCQQGVYPRIGLLDLHDAWSVGLESAVRV
jgi:hypothetical protein